MEDVGGKDFGGNRNHDKDISRGLPGGRAGDGEGDGSRAAAGATAANRGAALAGGAAVAGHIGLTATTAGHQTGAGTLTMRAAGRRRADRSQKAAGQRKNRAQS